MAGYSSDTELVPQSTIGDPATAFQKPIIFLIDRMNQFKWKICLRDFSENIMAIKFDPTGTFIVAVLENDPLTLIFIRVSDSFILGTQRHNRPAGYIQDPRPCQGECIAFSEIANHMYFALQSIYLNTMEGTYSPLKCFDRWQTFNQLLCIEKRYEVMKASYAVDITGATPASITALWSARLS